MASCTGSADTTLYGIRPAGLVFDADGAGTCPGTEPREFCGTPTAATNGAVTVTVTAQDADANRAAAEPGHADVPGEGASAAPARCQETPPRQAMG